MEAIISFAGSIIVAIVAFFAVKSQSKINKGIAQSNLKESWISTLRDSISEYCETILMFDYKRNTLGVDKFEHSAECNSNKERIFFLRFKIQLLLSNTRKSHQELQNLLAGRNATSSGEVEKLDEILSATKKILDECWQEVQEGY